MAEFKQNAPGEQETVVVSETEGKQGVEINRMRYVTWIGTTGAILVLGVALLVYVT
jgi:hypothetical protein